MPSFKGFGARPSVQIVPLHGTEKEDLDRCLAAYKRQGHSDRRALDLVAISHIYMEAEEIGLTPGVDVQYDPNQNDGEGGIYLSPAMQAHMKAHVDEKAWSYWESEGMITTPAPEVTEIDGEAVVTARGAAKMMLNTARDPEGTNDGGEKARNLCRWALQQGGVSAFDAERKLRQWIAGDDTLLAELLSPMEAGFKEVARKQQEGRDE